MTGKQVRARVAQLIEEVQSALSNAACEARPVFHMNADEDDEALVDAMSALEDVEGMLDPIQDQLKQALAGLKGGDQ